MYARHGKITSNSIIFLWLSLKCFNGTVMVIWILNRQNEGLTNSSCLICYNIKFYKNRRRKLRYYSLLNLSFTINRNCLSIINTYFMIAIILAIRFWKWKTEDEVYLNIILISKLIDELITMIQKEQAKSTTTYQLKRIVDEKNVSYRN